MRSTAAASAAQDGDEVIDAAGGTLLPGLIDAHVHLVPGALTQSLNFGVTTVLDMFSTPDLVAFRAVIGSQAGDSLYQAAFDFDGDGFINTPDLIAFRNRIGSSI